MTDRRRNTSRANLAGHIPAPISPHGTAVLHIRIPAHTMDRLRRDADAYGITISALIRQQLHDDLGYDMGLDNA